MTMRINHRVIKFCAQFVRFLEKGGNSRGISIKTSALQAGGRRFDSDQLHHLKTDKIPKTLRKIIKQRSELTTTDFVDFRPKTTSHLCAFCALCDCPSCQNADSPCHHDCDPDNLCQGCEELKWERQEIQHEIDQQLGGQGLWQNDSPTPRSGNVLGTGSSPQP